MEPILEPILGPERPKRDQDEPKRAIRSFKEPKSCILKNLKKPLVFKGFWLQRPLKRASRGLRRLPKGTQRNPRPQKKESEIGPKNYKKLDQFWSNFGSQNGNQKKQKNISGTPFPRISGVQLMPRQKIRERGKKPTGTGIIRSKRKGGIRPYKAL